ncbi:GNAT family N-acetyltransferase [Lichenicola cladoniae]|uniref:GNAT family N-acetyltransferase n=1 Tax=Lichenicola cladoniae TaxID=1484109 RepID=UPI001953BEA5|nr:GNAT family N-acetyltransferase [Lichenicola cladoniae]
MRLRDAVLRTPLGLAFSKAELEQEASQLHLGLYAGTTLAGVVVLVPPTSDSRIWKLRQMAVAPAFRGKRGGATLIAAAEREMRDQDAPEVMLHARESAVGFYTGHGYLAEDRVFEEVTIAHRCMWKTLDPTPPASVHEDLQEKTPLAETVNRSAIDI